MIHMRHLLATVCRCFAVKVETSPLLRMKEARTLYTSRVKGRKGHGLGPPDSFAMAALVFDVRVALQKKTSDYKAATTAVCDKFLADFAPGSIEA